MRCVAVRVLILLQQCGVVSTERRGRMHTLSGTQPTRILHRSFAQLPTFLDFLVDEYKDAFHQLWFENEGKNFEQVRSQILLNIAVLCVLAGGRLSHIWLDESRLTFLNFGSFGSLGAVKWTTLKMTGT